MNSLITAIFTLLWAAPALGFATITSLESVVEAVKDMHPLNTVVVLDLHETLAESASASGLGTTAFLDALERKSLDWQALAELQANLELDSQSILRHCRKLVSFFGEQVL